MPENTKDIKDQNQDALEELETMPEDQVGPDYGEILADWHFAESVTHDRSRLWYVLFIIIVVGLLAFSYFSKSPLFAVILVLGLIVYIITEKRGPSIFHLLVTEDGLLINDKFISYDDLASFYIIYYPPQIKNLYLQPNSSFKPLVTIPLGEQNPIEIRRILLRYIKEDLAKEEMPLSDGLIHRLKL